jgi:hypothetical protein
MHLLLRLALVVALLASVVTWVGGANGASAQGQVYQDSMDSSATGLLSSQSPDPARFVYGYQNSQFIIQTLEQGWTGDLLAFANVPAMPDVSVKIDFSIAGDLTGKYAFVGCRAGNDDTAYMFEVHPDTGQANIWRFDLDDAVNLATVTDTSAITVGSANNSIEIRCQGSTITGFANGAQVLTAQDSTYTAGDPFIGTGKNNATTDLLLTGFDNLVITDLGAGAPVQPTQAPVQPTQAPVQPTQPPTQPTQAPIQPTQAPVQPTTQAPPVQPTTGTTGDVPLVPIADPAVDPAATLDDAFFLSLGQDPVYESSGATGDLSNGSPQFLSAGVNLPDFYAELYYLTPPVDPAGAWTFGFCFWADANGNCYDFFVSSNGTQLLWGLGVWGPNGYEILQSGDLPADAIDLTPGAENELTMVVYKGIALLSTNTYLLDASLPVPGQPFGGDIKATVGYIAAVETETRTLPMTITYVAIWDMSSGVYPDILAVTETPADPAQPTQAPVQPTQAPIQPTTQAPPAQPTQPGVQPTVAPPPADPTVATTSGSTADPALTQAFETDRAAAQASAAVFSSPAGTLTQLGDSFNVEAAGVSLTDLYATATYVNPTDMSVNWDIGMGFRDRADNTEYRFVVRSDGAWVVTVGTGSTVAEGNLANFNASPGGTNTIEVVAKGTTGLIVLNGQVIQQLDLSANMIAGDVYIASGMYVSSSVAGREVPYQNFAVYQIAA